MHSGFVAIIKTQMFCECVSTVSEHIERYYIRVLFFFLLAEYCNNNCKMAVKLGGTAEEVASKARQGTW